MVKVCIHFLYLLRRQIWKENTMVTFHFKAQCTYFKSLNVFELYIYLMNEKKLLPLYLIFHSPHRKDAVNNSEICMQASDALV